MTVFDRPFRTLRNTFAQLRRNNLAGTEIIVVDDGSTKTYDRIKDYCTHHEMPVEWIRLEKDSYPPHTYRIGSYNNPTRAWNTALDAARGEVIVTLGSDIMLPISALKKAKLCGRGMWHAAIIDIDTNQIYVGKGRYMPLGFAMAWNRSFNDQRWDEEYLKGMAFDDNDFSGRLALSAKTVTIDNTALSFHQSHFPTAYSDGHRGHDINERYTWKKWGGVPWDGTEYDPLHVERAIVKNNIVLRVSRSERARSAS
jgi:glycosyltransferase involved in cell wall biosynthesis